MKQLLNLLLLFSVTIVLWGCPYDSPYGIDETAQQNIDESLLGSWATFIQKPGNDKQQIEEAVKVIFTKNTDQEYNVAITGYIDELKPYHLIENDTILGTAYISIVSGKQFLNTLIKGKTYIAEVKKDSSSISILCLAERFTAKYIKNSAELRKMIESHYRFSIKPSYDEYFALRNLQRVN